MNEAIQGKRAAAFEALQGADKHLGLLEFDPPNDDANSFDLNDWLDEHDDEPAREELEPDYSSGEAAS